MRYSLCLQGFWNSMAEVGLYSSFCTNCVNFSYLKFISNCSLSLGKRPRFLKVVDELFWSDPCLPLQLHLKPSSSIPSVCVLPFVDAWNVLSVAYAHAVLGLELLHSYHSSPLLCLPLLLINSKITSPERPSPAL